MDNVCNLCLCSTPSKVEMAEEQEQQSSLFSLFFFFFVLHLLENRNKLREYWLPRITDKLTMIGSQFMHIEKIEKIKNINYE